MENEKQLSPEESLALISNMIQKARGSYQKGSFFFLLWGSLLAAQGFFNWYITKFEGSPLGNLGWGVVGLVGGAISIWYGTRKYNQTNSLSETDKLYNYLWNAYLGGLFTVIFLFGFQKMDPTPMIMIITGIPTVFTGLMTRFWPFVFGGVFFWVFAIISVVFYDPLDYSLWFSISIITGYILPGILFKVKKEYVIS